jgi:photosystem II stability/assembly factor-like uncharacterized protein
MRTATFLRILPAALTLLTTRCAVQRSFQPDIPNGGRAVALAVDPRDERRIVVASETGGLFRSADGGDSWQHASGAITFGFTDVLFTGPDTLLAAARDDMRAVSGGGLWRSVDGGKTWARPSLSAPTTACRNDLAAWCLTRTPGTDTVWCGTGCGLAFSSDRGASWTFLSPRTNLGRVKIQAVKTAPGGHLKVLTSSGVQTSTDGGKTWKAASSQGLPPWSIQKEAYNQIALSPFNHRHIFWAFNYYEGKMKPDSTIEWIGHNALYLSTDNAANWSLVRDSVGAARPPFVQVAAALSGAAQSYDLYYTNGGSHFDRATVSHGASPSVGSWTRFGLPHADIAALALRNDGKTPYLLAGDGGLHRPHHRGLNWIYTGGGAKGYNALQVTELVGQRQLGGKSHLYFATQDNDIWASTDRGESWTEKRCCEGFFLQIPGHYMPAAQTRLTGVACGACGNFIAAPGLADQTGFPNAPNYEGAPCLV